LWEAWQVDYIGPFRKSEGKCYILVGVEIVSGLVQAKACAKATGENTVKALKEWFGTFPKPQSIQSDNGSHFTAKIVQEWVAQEGISWVFHTPYYPQANGIVERTNGLLKRFLKPHKSGWAERVGDAVTSVNSRWGTNGCPKITAFCPQASTIMPTSHGSGHSNNPSHFPGQPVLVELPTVGAVPLVLDTLGKKYIWKARDACGKVHKIHTKWIIPSF